MCHRHRNGRLGIRTNNSRIRERARRTNCWAPEENWRKCSAVAVVVVVELVLVSVMAQTGNWKVGQTVRTTARVESHLDPRFLPILIESAGILVRTSTRTDNRRKAEKDALKLPKLSSLLPHEPSQI